MRAAKDRYAAAEYHAALRLYDDALDVIEDMLSDDKLCIPVLMAKIVTHHNRAAACTCLKHYTEADAEYYAAHAFVRAVVDDRSLSTAVRETAQGRCAITFAEWQAFRKKHGLTSAAPVPSAGQRHGPRLRVVR